jgi:hypothetical protein
MFAPTGGLRTPAEMFRPPGFQDTMLAPLGGLFGFSPEGDCSVHFAMGNHMVD